MPANLENSAVATGLEKVSFHSNHKEGQWQRLFKLPTIQLQSFYISKVMLEILQARFQQYMNQELSDVQVKKTQRNQRSNWQHSLYLGESKGILEKHLPLLN